MKMTATFPKYLYKIQKLYTVIGHPKSFFKQEGYKQNTSLITLKNTLSNVA